MKSLENCTDYKIIIEDKVFKNDLELVLINLKESENTSIKNFNDIEITNEIIKKQEYIELKRTIKVINSGNYSISLFINHDVEDYQVFIPSVMYEKNKHGKGNFARIDEINKYWSFVESRIALPGCIELYSKDKCLIVSHKANEIQSSTTWREKNLQFRIPAIEYPYSYLGKNKLEKSDLNSSKKNVYLEANQIINQTYFIYYNNKVSKGLFDHYFDYSNLICDFTPSSIELTINNFKALLLNQLLFLVERKDGLAYIKMGKDNYPYQEIYEYTSASFLVKSVEAASIFIDIDYKKIESSIIPIIHNIFTFNEKKYLQEDSYESLAYKIGDFFLQAEKKFGVYRDCYSLNKDIWGGYLGIGENDEYRFLINSRTNGEALLAYLNLANKSDYKHKIKYYKLIDNICNFYIANQQENGNYGRWLDEDGTIVDEKGTNGAHIFLFFIIYYLQTGREELFKSIRKATSYYSNLVILNNYYGDTLDADSFDKEAGQILLKCFINLYEIEEFQNDYYIGICKKCANYLISWIQMDNIKFDKNTPLGKLNFKTKGYTSVSIANQHLDCYGMMIAYDFLKLDKLIGKPVYRKYAKCMISACFQLISSPNNLLGRFPDFLGWIPEQINHTQWDYFNDEKNISGYYSINIAWVQVLVLNYLRKIENEFSEVLDEL